MRIRCLLAVCCLVATTALAACSTSSSKGGACASSNGSGSLTSTGSSTTITVQTVSAAFNPSFRAPCDGGSTMCEGLTIILSGPATADCSGADAAVARQGSLELELVVGSLAPGTYAAHTIFSTTASACDDGDDGLFSPGEGTVTLTRTTATELEGTYSVTQVTHASSAASYSGSFDVSICPVADGG